MALPTRGIGLAALSAAVAIIIVTHLEAWSRPPGASTIFFAVASAVIVGYLALAARGRSFAALPVAAGRVVAILPTYNERPEVLSAAIHALTQGPVVPDVIHVVDDGSIVPATIVHHPLVRWHRQANLGKRHAQAVAIRQAADATFILTVDSDSVVHPDALEQALRAMSDPRVQAVTATCVVRRHSQNLLTRLTDLEVVTGNAVMRRARSVLGVVAPTSGPFALYRAPLLLDNLDDYLASGTYGDDRRLTHYALLRGQVVACDEAVVEMEMPTTAVAMFRQRRRWFQGYFKYLGWEIRNLDGPALWLRVWNLVLIVTIPLVAIVALVVAPLVTGRVHWEPVAYWIALLYAHTAHYVRARPSLSRRDRLATWLFLTPLLVPLQWLILRPATYAAMTRLRSSAWVTRDIAAT